MVLLGLIAASLQSGKRTWDCWEGGKERVGLRSYCGVPSTQLTGVATVAVRIKVYNATGVLQRRETFILGTRVLLTCNVTGLPVSNEVLSYRWYHSHTGSTQERYQIHNRDPYYRVVDDTLLVDVTSWHQGGKYTCFVNSKFNNSALVSSHSLSSITVAG